MTNDYYTPTEVNEITTVHTQQSYLINGIEYRSVPEWLVKDHKMLKYVIISRDAKVLYFNMVGFCENENFRQVWTTPEVAMELGYDTKLITSNGFLWIGKGKDGYFLADRNVTMGDSVQLKRVIAATWLNRFDNQICVCPLDDDKLNIHADNLKWFTRKEYNDYMREYRKKDKTALPKTAPLPPNSNFDMSIPDTIAIPGMKIPYTGENLFSKENVSQEDTSFNPDHGLVPITAYRKDDEKIWYLILPDYSIYIVDGKEMIKQDILEKECKRIYEKLYVKGSKAQVNGYTVVSDGFVFP